MAPDDVGRSLENSDDRVLRLLDSGLLMLIKAGVAVAILPLIFAGLRVHDHYGFVRADAQIIRSFKQCEISSAAAEAIGKRARWWDCKSAKSLQRGFPNIDLEIEKSNFSELWFVLADGQEHRASMRLSMLAFKKPEPGKHVPIVYSPEDPAQVKALLTLADLAVLSFIGLAGLMMSGVAWRLRESRTAIANRIRYLIGDESAVDGGSFEAVGASPGPAGPLNSRGETRRTLGVG